MVTILGAGGAIGSELVKHFTTGEPVRLASRNPKLVPGAAEAVAADLSNFDDTLKAISGSRVAFLLVGLKYNLKVWRELWPRIMHNAIEACKRSNTRLVFFDNVYMYGKVEGAMTEETPFRPLSKKGEVRAQIATTLLSEMKAGNLTALIARGQLLRSRRPERHTQQASLRQVRQGRESDVANERFREALAHLHAGCREEPRYAG